MKKSMSGTPLEGTLPAWKRRETTGRAGSTILNASTTPHPLIHTRAPKTHNLESLKLGRGGDTV